MTTNPARKPDPTDAPERPGRGDLAVVGELLPYLRPYLGLIVLSLGLILASKVATLLVPLVLKRLVDQLNLERSLLMLPVGLLLAYGASRVGVTLFTELRQVVFARVMARTSRQITVKVFRHLHDLSLRFHLDRRTGGVARDLERGTHDELLAAGRHYERMWSLQQQERAEEVASRSAGGSASGMPLPA